MGAQFDKTTYVDLLITKLKAQDGTGSTDSIYLSGETGSDGFARHIGWAPEGTDAEVFQKVSHWKKPFIAVKDGDAVPYPQVGSVEIWYKFTINMAIVLNCDSKTEGGGMKLLGTYGGVIMSYIMANRSLGTGRIIKGNITSCPGTEVFGDTSKAWTMQGLAYTGTFVHTL